MQLHLYYKAQQPNNLLKRLGLGGLNHFTLPRVGEHVRVVLADSDYYRLERAAGISSIPQELWDQLKQHKTCDLIVTKMTHDYHDHEVVVLLDDRE